MLTSAFAYSVPNDTIVYVTPTGEKYHREDCSYISSSAKSMKISTAESKGYDACSRCDPDILTGSYASSASKSDNDPSKDSYTPQSSTSKTKGNDNPSDLLGMIGVVLLIGLGPAAAVLLYAQIRDWSETKFSASAKGDNMNFKEKLSTILTCTGFNLFYLLFLFFAFIPILPLGFPWWVDGLIVLSTLIFPVLGGVITLVLWGWSFIVMIESPFTWFSVIYFIGLAIYVMFFLIPTVLKNFR